MEQVLESVKSKVSELEDESLNRVCQQQNKMKDLQKEHKALQVLSSVFVHDCTKTAHEGHRDLHVANFSGLYFS